MAIAGPYYALRDWLIKPVPQPAPAPAPPVCVLDTPTLRIELVYDDTDCSPELEQLSENWAINSDSGALWRVRTTPELPGLHGRLVSSFRHSWHGGLLLQVVEGAAGETAVASWLGWADPATQTWQPLVEAGEYDLYHPKEAAANVIEGYQRQAGKIRLELLPASARKLRPERCGRLRTRPPRASGQSSKREEWGLRAGP